MANMMVGLLAESFIHSGAGTNEGAIDLPVAREAASGYPFIPGSGMKGALRELAEQRKAGWVNRCFGRELDTAGGVLFGDARLLLLPVRSLTGCYRWVTCPHLIERLRRDMQRAGFSRKLPAVPDNPPNGALLGNDEQRIFLEERTFEIHDPLPENLAELFAPFMRHEETKKRLTEQLVIINNDDFNWFTSYALPVQARNDLEYGTKKSNNLWYEESLPPDTLMYCLLGERTDNSGIDDLKTLLETEQFIQSGGNETIGQGWFGIQIRTLANEGEQK